jgi:hypothetical protein
MVWMMLAVQFEEVDQRRSTAAAEWEKERDA